MRSRVKVSFLKNVVLTMIHIITWGVGKLGTQQPFQLRTGISGNKQALKRHYFVPDCLYLSTQNSTYQIVRYKRPRRGA